MSAPLADPNSESLGDAVARLGYTLATGEDAAPYRFLVIAADGEDVFAADSASVVAGWVAGFGSDEAAA